MGFCCCSLAKHSCSIYSLTKAGVGVWSKMLVQAELEALVVAGAFHPRCLGVHQSAHLQSPVPAYL